MIDAQAMDVLGFIAFLILLVVGIKMLKSKKRLPDWISWLVILIASGGLVFDGYVVISNFLI